MITIALDYDNTLADSLHPPSGHKMGPPMPGALEAVQRLAQHHNLIVFSARAATFESRKSIEDWLKYFGFPAMRVTAIKPPHAAVFVDDRGYRFEDWTKTMRELPGVIADNQRRLTQKGG